MALRPEDFLKEPVASGPGYTQGRSAMIDLLAYRALEDLSRGWRDTQPNLKQAGLLSIEYEGLSKLAGDDSIWRDAPFITDVPADRRLQILREVLDHLRMQLAIEANALTEERTRSLTIRASQWLREPWTLEDQDRLKTGRLALLPQAQPSDRERRADLISLGARSAVARYLRSSRTWDAELNLPGDEAESFVSDIVARLRGHILFVENRRGQDHCVRVLAGTLRWTPGDGDPPGPDPVRSRSLHLRREIGDQKANAYFAGLYGQRAHSLRGMVGHEHTGQVAAEDRIEREEQFRNGKMPVFFSSPTMELGVDISDLYAVHLRNIPPTPANYAQRSGGAGRGGRPALIAAFAAEGNVHDRYFFKRRNRMIAGAVAPAKMDLWNKELVEAHLHSTWLAIIGLSVGREMVDILALDDDPAFPLLADKKAQIEGPAYDARAREVLAAARDIVDRAPEVKESWWYGDQWLEDTVRNAREAFDTAFDRWLERYRSALSMRDAARKIGDSPRGWTPTGGGREKAGGRSRETELPVIS